MKRTTIIALTLATVTIPILIGCVQRQPKSKLYSEVYEQKPKTVLVLPPINKTTAAEAKSYYSTTIAPALTKRGYYVFPYEIVAQMMKAEGSYQQNVKKIPPKRFKDAFGADTVLYITITEWDTTYLVVAANVTVGLKYELVSTKSSQVIWSYEDTLVMDTSGGQTGGGGLAGLAVQVAVTALKTATTRYIDVARRVNKRVLKNIPHGPYHVKYMKEGDKQKMINVEKVPTKRLREAAKEKSQQTEDSQETSNKSDNTS